MSTLPPPYDRQATFTSFSTEPAPTVGQDLEAEFNKVKQSLDATQSRLTEIQRDDGRLKNDSVHPDALSQAVRAILAYKDGDIRGAWVTGTVYNVRDVIEGPDGVTYVASVQHVANASFAVDLNAGRWLIIDSGSVLDAALRSEITAGTIEGPLRSQLLAAADGATRVGYTPPSTGAPSTVRAFLDALWASTGASLINWARTNTGNVTRTVLGKLFDLPVHLLDFVPVAQHAAILNGTSTYDCGPSLANAIAAAQANSLSANEVILPKGLINTAQTFTLTAPVRFTGQGGAAAPGYSSFPTVLGTTIKYTGVDTNAVMFTFNNVNYGGAGMSNLALNGNGVAKRGLILDAVLGFSSDGLHVTRCTNVLVGLISTGQTTSWCQFKNLYLEGEVDGGAGSTCLWLSGGNGGGGSGSNACHCTFENLHINHGTNRSGIYLGGVDNITFTQVYIFRASGTRPGVEVVHEQQGGVWFPVANTFIGLEAGAGGWVEPAGGNTTYPTACIYGYQLDNGQPLPVTNGRRLPFTTNNGDMVGVRSIGKTSYGTDWAGSVSALNGTTSTAVTFSAARSSAAYIVVINSPTTIGFAIQSKTTTGFTIAWESALGSTVSVDWLILGG